jgi:transcription antitermination factor NusG
MIATIGGTAMSNNRSSNRRGFLPGDGIKVIDGTFAGLRGVVVTLAEAQSLWQLSGGQHPPLVPTLGMICVALPVFGRQVPICLALSQVVADDQWTS